MLADLEVVELAEQEPFSFSQKPSLSERQSRTRELMTRGELAQYLGCGVSAVDGMTMCGLPVRRLLGEPIYSRREVESWLRSA